MGFNPIPPAEEYGFRGNGMPKFSIELKLYDEENEEKAVYRQSFIPFRLLKEAFKLQQWTKDLQDPQNVSPEVVDNLGDFVVAFFGNKFTRDELMDGAELDEVMAVITQIVSKIDNPNPNPPPM
jgi:hypothetical protein